MRLNKDFLLQVPIGQGFFHASLSKIVLHCILHAPIVSLAAFRWPKVFPFSPIFFAILRASSMFVEYPKVSRVPSLPPARPFRVVPPRSNRGGPVQLSIVRITGQEDLLSKIKTAK